MTLAPFAVAALHAGGDGGGWRRPRRRPTRGHTGATACEVAKLAAGMALVAHSSNAIGYPTVNAVHAVLGRIDRRDRIATAAAAAAAAAEESRVEERGERLGVGDGGTRRASTEYY